MDEVRTAAQKLAKEVYPDPKGKETPDRFTDLQNSIIIGFMSAFDCDIIRAKDSKIIQLTDQLNRDVNQLNFEKTVIESEYKGLYLKLVDEISSLKQGGSSQKPIIMEENRPDTCIIIIVYNTSRFIKKQVELIRRFHKEPIDIIIVDNSFDPEVVEAIKYYNNTELKCRYLKTDATSRNGSDSHGFALNLSYLTFKEDYKYIAYTDHDLFVTREFSVKELLGDKIMVGMGQRRGDLEYFWPGCLAFNNDAIDRSLICFSPSHELKMDTGGFLHRIIDRYGKDKTAFFNEIHVQNPDFNKSMYNFYSSIHDGLFYHALNGSAWNKDENTGHDERINSFMNIIEEKTKL